METTTQSNYKYFDKTEDKPFYAAYLNTAVQNVFIVLRDISEKLSIHFNANDDTGLKGAALLQKLQSDTEPETSAKIIKALNQAFPFLHTTVVRTAQTSRKEDEAIPYDYYKVLNEFISYLISYRNYFSHVKHEEFKTNKYLPDRLYTILGAARNIVKERFKLEKDEVVHLESSKGFKKPNPEFKHHFVLNEKLSQNGFLFFTCLWLEKKDAQKFLKKHFGFKRSETKNEKATLEAFTIHCVRLPHPRLYSDNSEMALLLDMINELKCCPGKLFPHLSTEDKDRFLDKESREENNETEDKEYELFPLLKRKQNRFYYFALRYLEQRFNLLKFHIDLGNYSFHAYEQEIEGTPRIRRWVKKLFAFGNLNDFEVSSQPQEWKDKLKKLDDDTGNNDSEIYITHTTPHYHFSDNAKTIGFRLIGDYVQKKKNNTIWPEIKDYNHEGFLAKKEKNKDERKNVREEIPPQGWISLYELPAICFYEYLFSKGIAPQSAETVIRQYRNTINSFFTDVQDGIISNTFTKESLQIELQARGLQIQDIPTSIVRYLCNEEETDTEQRANKRLEEMLEKTIFLLKKLEVNKSHYTKKPGSRNYVEMKCGHMADFVARDLLLLQNKTGEDNGKANSTEFQLLQSKLAYFSANKATLNHTFGLCNLINAKNAHPFLHKIDVGQCKGILDFYNEYLSERKAYLQNCINHTDKTQLHFLQLNRDKYTKAKAEYIKDSIKAMKQTINLPRGLFRKPILEAFAAHEPTKTLADSLANEKHSVSYIIERYFTLVLQDATQEFYGYSRSYEVLNKLYDKRNGKKIPLKDKPFSPNELVIKQSEFKLKLNKFNDTEKQIKYKKQYKQLLDNEKQIRLTQTCDMVQFCMIGELYVDQFYKDKNKQANRIDFSNKFKLNMINPDDDKGILSTNIEMKLQVLSTTGELKTIINKDIKIKNYGNFRAFLKDRRISSLLPYIPDTTIHVKALEKELEWFTDAREEVFEKIHEFEAKAIDSFRIEPNDIGYIEHKEILNKFSMDKTKYEIINNLRNAFSHSEYPPIALFKDKTYGTQFKTLTEYDKGNEAIKANSIILQLKNLTIELYDELINTLN